MDFNGISCRFAIKKQAEARRTSVFLQPMPEGPERKTEQFGGLRLDAAGLFQGFLQQRLSRQYPSKPSRSIPSSGISVGIILAAGAEVLHGVRHKISRDDHRLEPG